MNRFKVLVPLDFSDASRRALAQLVGWAVCAPFEVHLVHVVDEVCDGEASCEPVVLAHWLGELERAAATVVDDVVPDAGARARLGQLRHHLIAGHPATEITSLAAHLGVSLVMMGTHGRGGALKLLMGSVARGVARHAPCPVVLVGPGARMRTARPSRILCAVDGSDAPERAVRAAVDLARRLDDELVLLVVGDSSRTDIEALLPACSKVRSVAVEELQGDPVIEILLRAQAKECELIVVGTDDRAALLGTVGSNLLRDAPCAVLTIPPKPA